MGHLHKQKILIATSNLGKYQQFCEMMAPLQFDIALPDFSLEAVEETASTFVENALIKAHFCAKNSCESVGIIADDSGLEVDALNGQPGIYSARFSGEHSTAQHNNAKLLQLMEKVPAEKRTARFTCVLVYLRYRDDPTPIIAYGHWYGRIAFKPEGCNGFGYDPIFIVDHYNCTVACLDAETKNKLCHRKQALDALVAQMIS